MFRGNDEGVSKIVKDAYRNYEDLHFETETISKYDQNRHVKLIRIARDKVQILHESVVSSLRLQKKKTPPDLEYSKRLIEIVILK